MVVTDDTHPESAGYLVPMTYRGAPLDGAEHALIGTTEHGVLGQRWVYDGCHDPVLVAQLWALVEGRAQPQAQSISDTPDREVTRSYAGEGFTSPDVTPPPPTTRRVPSSPHRRARASACTGSCVPPRTARRSFPTGPPVTSPAPGSCRTAAAPAVCSPSCTTALGAEPF